MNEDTKKKVKLLLDFAPVILFFVAFKKPLFGLQPLIFASIVLTVFTVIALLISYILKIKPDKLALYTNIGVIVFGILTIYFNNPEFIKAKLTIINSIFAFIMLYCYYTKKPIIKSMFAGKIEMEDNYWNALNLRFGLMFVVISILNLYFWKLTSDAVWVNFKTFGVLPIMIAFFAFQVRFILKFSKKN